MHSIAILARNLKRLRQLRELSQEALADEAGMNRTYVSDLECQKSAASLDRLEKLADALGVKACQLIDEEYDPSGRFG